MIKPLIVINAKTYPESSGPRAVRLALACERAAETHKAKVWLALQPFDIAPALAATKKTQLFAQHVDPSKPGRNTGYLVPANLKQAGVIGSILNHSEHKLPFPILRATVLELKKQKLKIIICADTAIEAKRAAELKPDYIAVEPPELIGGKVSVTTRPEVIIKALAAVGKVPLLVGAGVKNGADVQKGIELGAVGVLVASGVVLARSPQKAIEGLLVI